MASSRRRHGHHRAAESLRGIHATVLDRGSTVVLVTAPDGSGKTHLVDTFLAGTTGVTSVLVRGLPWETSTPGVVARRVLARLPGGGVEARGGDDEAGGADELHHDEGHDDEGVGRGDGAGTGARPPADALATALGAAGSGTVIVVDDADHADPESLRALASALESAVGASVLLVLTTTSPSPGSSAVLCASLARHTLRLGALDPEEIRDLVSARLGVDPSPAAARRVLEYTGGDAGAVAALVDEVDAAWWSTPYSPPPVPAHLAREIGARLEKLAPAERAVIHAAAVLAPPVALTLLVDLVAAVHGGGDDRGHGGGAGPHTGGAATASRRDVLPALDVAHHAGLLTVDLVPGAATLRFRTPLVRTAIQRAIPPQERLRLHTAAAALTADADPDAALEHRAAVATGPDPDLCDAVRARAAVHARAGRWTAAGHAFLTAAALTTEDEDRAELTLDGIDALVGAGRISEARSLVHGLDRVRPDPRRDAVLGYLALHLGHAGEARALLGRALDADGTEPAGLASAGAPAADAGGVELAQKVVLQSLCGWRPDEIARWAQVVTSSSSPDQPSVVETRAIALIGAAVAGGGGPADEDAHADLAPALAQRFEMASGWIALAQDDLESARRRLGAAVSTPGAAGSARISLWAQAWLARTHLLRGEWDDALRVVDSAARRIDDLELDLLSPVVHWSGAVIRSMRGDHVGAAAHLARLTTYPDAYPVQVIPSGMGRMQMAAAAGDYSAVRRAAEPLVTLSAGLDIDHPGYWPWHDLYAHALVLAGRVDEAEQLIAEPERRALDTGHRSTLARLGAVRSRIAAVRGDVDECVRIFHRSHEYLDGLSMPFYSARMHFGFGQTLRRAGRRRDAHLALGTARDLYEQLGARAYVERCDRERRAGGVDVARAGGTSTLTPQEQAVATLVAAGRSNAQAAEELFLSVKTVQYHLTRIYSKLGVRGRTELALHVARSRQDTGPAPDTPGDPWTAS